MGLICKSTKELQNIERDIEYEVFIGNIEEVALKIQQP